MSNEDATGNPTLLALQNEVQELRQQLNHWIRLHDNMDAAVYTLVHDMRRSLSLIRGFADCLLHSPAELSAEERTRYLQVIFQSGCELDRQIDRLFLLVHVRDDELPERRPLAMREVVEEALARLHYVLEQRQATVTPAGDWPVALGYEPWVEELWYTLLSEVLWLTGDGAHLTLGGEPVAGGARFWVQVESAGPDWRTRLSAAEPSALVQRLLTQLEGQMEPVTDDRIAFTLKA